MCVYDTLMITFRSRLDLEVHLNSSLDFTIFTMLFAGQIAVFSSFEKDDLQIEE